MMEGLKPYAEYKDSGLPWIGKIPRHWDVKRFKYLLHEINTRSLDGHEQLLRVSQYTGVTPRLSLNGDNEPDTRAESLVGYKQVAPGDLVINIMIAWNGSLGVARSAGIVSPAYCVYRFNDHAEPWYYHNLLRIPLYKGRIKVDSTGVIESRLRLYSDKLFSIEAILPKREEQATIARFVEAFSRRVDRLIRDKRRLIELLNEQKQAIIHRAVTRGLDPNVRLKPSGIEWLGDVPERWDIKRLKAIAQIRYGLGQPPREAQTGLPLIRATNVDNGRILEKNLVRVDPADVPKTRNAFLKAGEIIVVRSGALTADSAIIPKEYEGAVAGYDMVVTVKKAYPEFIALALLSSYVQADQLIIASMRAAQPHLNAEELGTAIFLLPPYEQQKKIVEFVQRTGLPIETTIMRLEREIALIREYRTRLIADVVTGKLDVRGVELPVMDEAEVLEDINIGEDIETEAEELIESEEVTDADN